MTRFYFAYGSNMNPARVTRRKFQFEDYDRGTLEDFALAFNKRSSVHPGAASANVIVEQGSRVEGLVYRMVEETQIEVMDPFEGYPIRYRRERLPIQFRGDTVAAWVYLANRDFIADGLKPLKWYLDHLLAGQPHLSEDYYARLCQVECLPESEVEPL